VYSDSIPAYLRHDGVKGAKLRSHDLSRMAGVSNRFMDRYVRGLEDHIVRKRSLSKTRTMKYFKATELEWDAALPAQVISPFLNTPKDVSIYGYMQRLKAAGENQAD